MLLAVLEKVEGGYIARFDRHLKHPVEKVWSALTDNEKLAKWFSELSVTDLRQGGVMTFAMPNGSSEELSITELVTHSVLEYSWWGDSVRFEFYPEPGGCHLVLKRKIMNLTDHTPKDIAGWHVCLDVIEALLAGKTFEDRKVHWETVYPEYTREFAGLLG